MSVNPPALSKFKIGDMVHYCAPGPTGQPCIAAIVVATAHDYPTHVSLSYRPPSMPNADPQMPHCPTGLGFMPNQWHPREMCST